MKGRGGARATPKLPRAAETSFKQAARLASGLPGFAMARVKVVLDDGVKQIWNVASELFPGVVEIVDLWHARQHV